MVHFYILKNSDAFGTVGNRLEANLRNTLVQSLATKVPNHNLCCNKFSSFRHTNNRISGKKIPTAANWKLLPA